MEEIKVNEYVRTKKGYIDKIINIERYNEEEKWLVGENFRKGLNNGYYGRTTDNDITKHSPNIIDLIEVGDYVNGLKVIEKREDFHCVIPDNGFNYYEHDIKTILTKEQFQSVMYEV